MTDPLRLPPALACTAPGDDIADVLASIRRLIAKDRHRDPDAGSSPPTVSVVHAASEPSPPLPLGIPADAPNLAADHHSLAPERVATSHDPMAAPASLVASMPVPMLVPVPGPLAASMPTTESTPQAMPMNDPSSPPATRPAVAPQALSRAVDAAAARMAETARRVQTAQGAPDPPFRLDPNSLIPPVGVSPGVARRLNLSPEPLVCGDSPDGGAAPAPLAAALPHRAEPPIGAGLTPDGAAPPQSTLPAGDAASGAAHHARRDPDLSARVAAVSAPAPGPAPVGHDRDNVIAPLSRTEPEMPDASPLRQMLRDVIREELRAEIATQLAGDLRTMIHEEVAAVLSDAFSLDGPSR